MASKATLPLHIWLQPVLQYLGNDSQQVLAQHAQLAIGDVCVDNRVIGQVPTAFVALNSSNGTDNRLQHASKAVAAGAVVVLSDHTLASADTLGVPVLVVANLAAHLGALAWQLLYQLDPVTPVRVLAVTGTNGKTTVSRLIAELLTFNGHKTAVMGTTGNGILPHLVPSSHTTLDAISLHKALHSYAKQGAEFAVLEASSHGLCQGRLGGVPIEVAIFTNLSRDHLDYHGTLDAYLAAKALLFDSQHFPQLKLAILNHDDPASSSIATQCGQSGLPVQYYTTQHQADTGNPCQWQVRNTTYSLSGVDICAQVPWQTSPVNLHSPLLGAFNVSNLLAAIAAVHHCGMGGLAITANTPKLLGAAGRMQTISDPAGQRLFIIDYAHTPDAVGQVLSSLSAHVQGQLWCVLGCGGDRDKGKRPLMTMAAITYAQQVVLTADNPRSEAVEAILADMQQGVAVPNEVTLQVIADRRLAIAHTIAHAQAGDIVVIAGKGHEDYQEINGTRHHFSDVEAVQQLLGLT